MLIVAWIVFGLIPGFLSCTLANVFGRMEDWQLQPGLRLCRVACETKNFGGFRR